MEESGQPRWFWEPEQAVMAGASSNLAIQTTFKNIGEAKALAKFVELQIPVYIPFGDNEKSDLIADFNGKLNKVQVKTSEE